VRVRDRREAILSAGVGAFSNLLRLFMTNRARRLYIGVTNDLHRRVLRAQASAGARLYQQILSGAPSVL
jgi:hypothetical protein